MDKIEFKAIIQQHNSINAAFVEFPFSTEELFGKKGQVKIKALFDHTVEYRGSIAKMGHSVHCLGVTQAIRKQIGKTFGEEIHIQLWEDKEERIVVVPNDLQDLLNANKNALDIYEKLSYTHKKEYIRWIEEAKKEETRERRKLRMITMLLEGKKEI